MEEAAALFGSADSNLDPFGSIDGSGSDDLVESATFPPSEPSPPEIQEANSRGVWYNGQSNHYQSQGSLQEYSWQSGDDVNGHYNSQPRYGESTSSTNSTYPQQLNLHESDHSQYL